MSGAVEDGVDTRSAISDNSRETVLFGPFELLFVLVVEDASKDTHEVGRCTHPWLLVEV